MSGIYKGNMGGRMYGRTKRLLGSEIWGGARFGNELWDLRVPL